MKLLLIVSSVFFVLLFFLHRVGLRCNLTPSLPKGIYRIVPGKPERGGFVAFCLDSGEWAALARKRGYLGSGSCPSGLRPLLKLLAGLPGDVVTVTTEGIAVAPTASPARRWPAPARHHDTMGRALPPCSLRSGVIPSGMALVLANHPGSFDSRFFGLVPLTGMVRVEPVFTFSSSNHMEMPMNKEELNATATDAFRQAQDGLAVSLDPEQAEGMGAFPEDALTLQDVMEDACPAAQGGDDRRG